MRARLQSSDRLVKLSLSLDPEDELPAVGQQGMRIELVTNGATIRLPRGERQAHPDLMALVVLTILRPWCRRRLLVEGGVSRAFATAVHAAMSIEIGPVDDALEQRAAGSQLGLLYSGGPDCMAAAVLIGQEMPLFHLKRVKHPRIPDRANHVRVDVNEALVRRVEERGEEVHLAETDLEYLCRPFPTYPQWTALATGPLLQADELDLGGLVTGRNISGMYLRWGMQFDSSGDDEEAWDAVFAAVGVPLVQPLAGASDVSNMRIARDYRHYDLARSCQLGTLEGPCSRCRKCLTKELIRASLEGRSLPDDLVAGVSGNESVVAAFSGPPPYDGQHTLVYTLARVPGLEETFLAGALQRLQPSVEGSVWVDRFYGPALEPHVPSHLVSAVREAIEKRIGWMTDAEERIVETWDGSGP